MAIEIKMPQLGLTMTEGLIGKWLKQEGDVVKKGDALVQITTDKLATDVESEAEGILRVICAKEGDEVPVQGLIAIIGDANEEIIPALSYFHNTGHKSRFKLYIIII
jgi:pyruvate/2-oxoglutarate dehydrogenase complex dihydrolipoamide acyltransferase (E2) component